MSWEPSSRPVFTKAGSTIPGSITTSTCLIGGTIFSSSFFVFSLIAGNSGISFWTFIIPHTTRMNTMECTRRPTVDGQPVGVAIPGPRTRLTRRKVSGLAMMKKVRPEIKEVMNFSCCFWPLHPQPQSLKSPMIIFYFSHTKKCQTIINVGSSYTGYFATIFLADRNLLYHARGTDGTINWTRRNSGFW